MTKASKRQPFLLRKSYNILKKKFGRKILIVNCQVFIKTAGGDKLLDVPPPETPFSIGRMSSAKILILNYVHKFVRTFLLYFLLFDIFIF